MMLWNFLLGNNNLCGKLFSSLEWLTTFGESFKVISVPFFIPNFNLLSWEIDNYTFKVLYWVILYWYYTKVKKKKKKKEKMQNTFRVPCEKSKIIYFAYSMMKKIAVFAI